MATQSAPSRPANDPAIGEPVFDKEGKKLGTVKALMPATTGLHPGYVVISRDGFLGIGRDNRPVPEGALFPHANGWRTGCRAEDFTSAPCFYYGEEPGERFWIGVDRHYGLEPLAEPDPGPMIQAA